MNPQVLDVILHNRRMAYAITDPKGRVCSFAGEPVLLWGAPLAAEEKPIGATLTGLVPELSGSEAELQAMLDGQLSHFQYQWVNREDEEGRPLFLTISVYPYSDGGTAEGLLYLAEDVTVQGIMQQELTQRHNELRLLQGQLERRNLDLAAANAELQLTNEIKSSFVSVAAHELRTPLTSIYGFLELFLDEDLGTLNPEQREYMQIMQDSTRRLLSTASNLLDVIRIESDRVELLLRPLPLMDLVENAIERFTPQMQSMEQTLHVDVAPDLPSALCDPARTEQVIGHLLSNASKFSPPGGRIEIQVAPDADFQYLRVSVRDSGGGIDACEQSKVFDRYYQTDGKDPKDGSGLGLYIVRSLVELHGGRAWCESEPGRGSAFHITIPIADTAFPFRSSIATELFARA